MHSKDFKQRDAQTIEADAHHRHTAHHLLLKTILIVSTLVGMLGMHTAQAVGTVPKLNYDYAAAEASCKLYDNQSTYSSKVFNLHPTGLVINIGAGTPRYGNQCQANFCSWTRQGTLLNSWLTPPVCSFYSSDGNPASQPVCPINADFPYTSYTSWGVYLPASLANVQCECKAGFSPDASGTRCVVSCIAPLVADAAGTACVAPPPVTPACPSGQVPHPDGGCMLNCSAQPNTHANMKGTACIPNDTCPLPYVTPLPTAASDVCTAALEANNAASIAANCPSLTSTMQNELDCLKEKMQTEGVVMQPPTATIRSLAYQRHFRDVWDGLIDLIEQTEGNPVLQPACATRRAALAAEKGCDRADGCFVINPAGNKQSDCPLGGHCLVATPAPAAGAAKHAIGKAVDIKGANVSALKAALQTPPPPKTVSQFLSEPSTAAASVCPASPQLKWGGAWGDNVHFYLQ
jgi:hypothetical protein